MDSDKEINDKLDHTSKYYYDHFVNLSSSVNRQFSDLLEPQDIHCNTVFDQLTMNARCLLVRLMLRTRTYFVVDSIRYSDIESIPDAVDQLIEAQFVTLNPDVSINELLPLLTKKEWLDLINKNDNNLKEDGEKNKVIKKTINRTAVESLVEQNLSVSQVYQRYSIVRLKTKAWLRKLQFLYFNNLHQSLSELILSDLNIRNFENYSLNTSIRLFDSKISIHLTLLSRLLGTLFEQFIANKLTVIKQLEALDLQSANSIDALTKKVLMTIKSVKKSPVCFFELDLSSIADVLKHQRTINENFSEERERKEEGERKEEQREHVDIELPFDPSKHSIEVYVYQLFFLIILAIDERWKKSEHEYTNSVAYKKFIRRRKRLCYQIGYQLERAGFSSIALTVYNFGTDSSSMERKIRIFADLAYHEKALSLCRGVLDQQHADNDDVNSRVDAQLLEFAESFGHKLSKKSQYQYWPKPKVYEPPLYELTLNQPEKPKFNSGAEEAVIEYLQRCGTDFLSGHQHDNAGGKCYFVENSLIMTVFSLCYWDLFYADVKGAFTHPFQAQPHDLFDDDFLHKRKELKQTLDQLWFSNDYFPIESLLEKRELKQAFQAPFMGMNSPSEESFIAALKRIPSCNWRVIFDRLWSNLRENSKGFPDLIFFPHQHSESDQYWFVEVKAPNDKLQNHQRRWMKNFNYHDIQHCVVNVKWN